MVDKPFIISQPIGPINRPKQTQKPPVNQPAFNQVLYREIQEAQEVKFSRHAQERLEARRITLNNEQISRLQGAVEKAQAKGSRESLIMIDDLAFVVSIKNKTVITAVDGENRKENVFTNIDSAVIS